MKRSLARTNLLVIASAIVCVLIAGTIIPLNAQSFEGVVQFNMTSERGDMPMTYMMKGDNVRLEFEGRPGMKAVILVDGKEKKSYMLISQMNSYMELPTGQSQAADAPKAQMKKTGKTEKILGYDCELLTITEGTQETEAWVTKGIGKFQMFQMGGPQKGNKDSWQKEVANSGFFPVRVTTKQDGKEIAKMVLTKVEKKSLESSIFLIPEGYQKMTMPMGRPRQ